MANNIVIVSSGGTTKTVQTVDNTGGGAAAHTPVHSISDSTGAFFMPPGDAAARPVFVQVSNGTQTLPSGDAVGRPIFAKIGDGTTSITVKAASTAAAATDTAMVVRPMMPTDGTNTQPSMDAAARRGYVQITDGTNSATVKAASTGAAATDTALVTRPLMPTDGTNTSPVGDAVARSIFMEITDGTTGPAAVKAASTAAVATDKALVVSLSPNTAGVTNADGGGSAGVAGAAGSKSILDGAVFTQFASLPAATTGQQVGNQCDQAGTLKMGSVALGTPVYGSADSGGAAAANVTLASAANRMLYLDGFDIEGLGATAGSAIAVTITGLLGGTLTYRLGVTAGATTPNPTLSKRFSPPLQASAVNTAIVVNVPSFGSGNTASSTNAYGHLI